MSINDKVNYYIKELLRIKNELTGKEDTILSNNETILRSVLKEVIENGNEYLLTKAFLYHILMLGTDEPYIEYLLENTLYEEISNLNNMDRAIPSLGIFIDYSCSESFDHHLYLNDYEKSLADIHLKTLLSIRHSKSIYQLRVPNSQYFLLSDILQIIGAYFLINKKDLSEYQSYVEPYINDFNEKLDEMKLQINITTDSLDCYEYDYNSLAKYIIRQLDNIKKEIR